MNILQSKSVIHDNRRVSIHFQIIEMLFVLIGLVNHDLLSISWIILKALVHFNSSELQNYLNLLSFFFEIVENYSIFLGGVFDPNLPEVKLWKILKIIHVSINQLLKLSILHFPMKNPNKNTIKLANVFEICVLGTV